MNPATINTTNVQQFGFTSTFDLENAKLRLDISSLTVFKPGGETSIMGINFEVIDPSGIPISTINFPSVAIDTGAGQTFLEINLSNSPSQYGIYNIKGVLREADGTDYTVTIPSKNICQPAGIKRGIVPGKFEAQADCTVPKIYISELTNMIYASKSPAVISKVGKLYYPEETLPPVSFAYTPFSVVGSGKVYTGDYTVKNKTTASYEMGDYVFVTVAYSSTKKFSVTCNSNMCDILCCLEKLSNTALLQCDTNVGRDAKKKLDEVAVPLMMAMSMEKCGKNAGVLLEEIAQKLNCDCNCDGSDSVEPKPIITTFDPVQIIGECATEVVFEEGVWVVKTKEVTVVKGDLGDQSLSVEVTQNDCAIAYKITINKELLAGDILNEIKNSAELKNIFNSLVITSGIDTSALDGKCVVGSTSCQYSWIEDATDAAKLVTGVTINSNNYTAPSGLGVTNALGIKTWLDSLGFGSWNVYYDNTTTPRTTVFNFTTADAIVSTVRFSLNGQQIVRQFSKSCGDFLEFIQAIIDYLCDIDESQIKLSQSYSVCFVGNNGQIQSQAISPLKPNGQPNTEKELLLQILQSLCVSFQNLKNLVSVNCATVKALYVASDPIISTDGVHGSRNGKCGVWQPYDLTNSVLDYLLNTNDTTLIDKFCQVKDRCSITVCNPVTYIRVTLIEPCPQITTINGSFTS